MKLPRHQRSRPDFEETFQRGQVETITAMDDGGHDIPNQVPEVQLGLKRMGLKRRSIPVRVVDPLGSGQAVELSCSVAAFLRLEPNRRGLHVSRIGDLLARRSSEVYSSLADYAAAIAEGLRESQDVRSANVSVEGVLSYLETVSGVKEKESIEHLDLFAVADFDGDRLRVSSGVGFNHITACPCVQETYRHSFSPNGSPVNGSAETTPLLTHTQRCGTRVIVSDSAEPLSLPALLAVIDSVVVRSQNTLPREFELLNVYRAHARPQFLEDALRDLLFGVYAAIRVASPDASIFVQAVSMESIHDFDLEGEIEFSVKELDRIFTRDGALSTGNRNGAAADHPALIAALRMPDGKTPAAHCR